MVVNKVALMHNQIHPFLKFRRVSPRIISERKWGHGDRMYLRREKFSWQAASREIKCENDSSNVKKLVNLMAVSHK